MGVTESHLIIDGTTSIANEKGESHLIIDPVIRRVSNYTQAHRGGTGPTGPAGPAGSGGASKTTLLIVTQQSPSGTVFFVNSGSTHYTFTGDAGNLGSSESNYLNDEAVQVYLRGTKLEKTQHTKWLTEHSYRLYMPVDVGDYLEILS